MLLQIDTAFKQVDDNGNQIRLTTEEVAVAMNLPVQRCSLPVLATAAAQCMHLQYCRQFVMTVTCQFGRSLYICEGL